MAVSFWLVPEFVGIVIGIWSLWVIRKSAFSVYPEPEKEFNLIVSGPYKIVRHPMYLALFLVLVPLVLSFPKVSRIVWLIIFVVNQLMKIEYEESILMKKIPEYRYYMLNTKKIIPLIY